MFFKRLRHRFDPAVVCDVVSVAEKQKPSFGALCGGIAGVSETFPFVRLENPEIRDRVTEFFGNGNRFVAGTVVDDDNFTLIVSTLAAQHLDLDRESVGAVMTGNDNATFHFFEEIREPSRLRPVASAFGGQFSFLFQNFRTGVGFGGDFAP